MAQQELVDQEKSEDIAKFLDKVDEKPKKPEQEPKVKEEKPKKKRSFLKTIFIFIGTILLVGVLYLGWLGFIPILSTLLGANQPRDLGVTYTEADLNSYYVKSGQKVLDFADAPLKSSGQKTIFANFKNRQEIYTSAEITARINDLSEWVYMPARDVQIKFSDGNIIEASGVLNLSVVDEFVSFIGGVGYSDEDVKTGLDWVGRFAGDPALYIKAEAKVINNALTLNVQSVKLNRWSPPMDEAQSVLYTGVVNALAGVAGMDIDAVTFDSAGIHFDGKAPTTIYVKTTN